MGLKPLHSSCATDCDLKILSVLQKSKQRVFEKKFARIAHVIITNEVSLTILQACMSLPRHIRKGVLIRRSIASNLRTEIFPSLSAVLSLCDVPKTVFFVNQNGGTSSHLGSTAPSAPHSDSTDRYP